MKQVKKLSKLAMLEQSIKQQTEEVARLEGLMKAARPRRLTPENQEKYNQARYDYNLAVLDLYKMKAEFNQAKLKKEKRDKYIVTGAFVGATVSLFAAPAIANKVKYYKKTQLKLKPAPIEKVVPAAENVQVNDTTTTIDDVVYTHDHEM